MSFPNRVSFVYSLSLMCFLCCLESQPISLQEKCFHTANANAKSPLVPDLKHHTHLGTQGLCAGVLGPPLALLKLGI